MRTLVLGGNGWLGGEIARAALRAGHDVSTFTRGVSGPSPEGAVELHGDRFQAGGMAALVDLEFDAAIDVARSPLQVSTALDAIQERCPRYVFVSTISVYAEFSAAPVTTEAPLHEPAMDEPSDEFDWSRYGSFKVQAEQLVRAAYPDRHVIARPGLIGGPGDPTDRLT